MIERWTVTILSERWEDESKSERRTRGKASKATYISDKLVWKWDVKKQAWYFEYECVYYIAKIAQIVSGSQTCRL